MPKQIDKEPVQHLNHLLTLLNKYINRKEPTSYGFK